MKILPPVNRDSLGARLSRPLLLSIGAAVLGFALVVAALGWYLRGELRTQILSRDVELFESIVALEYQLLEEEFAWLPVDYRHLAVNAAALRGVVAMTIYDLEGEVEDFVPATVDAEPLSAPVLTVLRARGEGIGSFHESVRLGTLFRDLDETVGEPVPMLEILVPVHTPGGEPVAYAHFWTDGAPIAAEFARLDQRLWWQGAAVWLGASLLVSLIGLLGIRHLCRTGQQLEERTAALEQANADLELAARSSAVGAISGHLLHGLKNPLAGLGAYLRAHGNQDAREAANRMQSLVRETLAVLRDASSERRTADWSFDELFQILRSRLEADANGRRVILRFRESPSATLSSKDGNLILLILENLVHNALDASSADDRVTVGTEANGDKIFLYVEDEGTGIGPTARLRLFQPGVSSKEGGSGLGLAISRQLARSFGGELLLRESGPSGTRFDLEVPARLIKFQSAHKSQ